MQIPQAIADALGHEKSGRIQQAEAIYREILEIDPRNIQVLSRLSALYHSAGQYDAAHELLVRAIAIQPELASLHINLTIVLSRLGRNTEAIDAARRALELVPNHPRAWQNLGELLQQTGNLAGAAEALNRSVQCKEDAGVYVQLSSVLLAQSRMDEALIPARRAAELAPKDAMAHNNLGALLQALEQTAPAIEAFRKAVALDPSLAMAHCGLGAALMNSGDDAAAIASSRKAIQLDPRNSAAHRNLATSLRRCGFVDESIEAFRQGIALATDPAKLRGWLIGMNYSAKLEPQVVFQEHVTWGEQVSARHARDRLPHTNSRDPQRRLRIGYVSADFSQHVVGQFIESILAHHDHARFEVFCYSNVRKPDDATARMVPLADHWRCVTGKSDEAVAQMIRTDGIDILVDLGGHTADNRLLTFARKPAPIQITYLGYPNTTGLPEMDFRLTDAIADPPGLTEHVHTEQLIRIPGAAWCYRPIDQTPAVAELPALRNGYITYGSFSNVKKLSDRTLAIWAQLLRSVPSARLLLKGLRMPQPGKDRLRKQFADHGIADNRVEILEPAESAAEHLQLYGRMDIALDPFPYNGTTTTCEAIYMGVPMVTLAGSTHVSRVGASLLTAIGCAQWIATSDEQYVQIAADLGENPEKLGEIRASLRARMCGSPLMQPEAFTRNLEEIYRQVWERWCLDRPVIVK